MCTMLLYKPMLLTLSLLLLYRTVFVFTGIWLIWTDRCKQTQLNKGTETPVSSDICRWYGRAVLIYTYRREIVHC
jgi:hypothetical protein